ncbi:MAG: peptidyl-tRNA hydrolase Pth2 [Candidatus Hadarchaeia archaeon]
MTRFKQVIVVRSDLNMSPGKLSVQVAHGSVSAAEKAMEKRPEWYKSWKKERQKKVAVKVKNADVLKELKSLAENLNIPHKLVQDAGLTELPPGTPTVLGIGPGPEDKIDKITGDLPLL